MRNDVSGYKKGAGVIGALLLLFVCVAISADAAAIFGRWIAKIGWIRESANDSLVRILWFALFSAILTVLWPVSLFLAWKVVGKRRW